MAGHGENARVFDTFDDVRRVIGELSGPDLAAERAVQARQRMLTKPAGSLGRLEELAAWLAAWQGREAPKLERMRIAVFAGNHGVAAQGVSAFPAAVTAQMVANFAAGGAAINQLAKMFGAELHVVALDLDRPTEDFTRAPAMSEAACVAAMRIGAEALESGLDLLVLGEMGIANTTSAAALAAALLGGSGAYWAGPGTGLDDHGVRHKATVVDRALSFHGEALRDPLEALRRLGGRELAAIAGAVVVARVAHVPVLLDGFVCCAAALVPHALRSDALAHTQIGHRSAEPGHARLLEALGKPPLLSLNMRLGEGSGAALAIPILQAAIACHDGMATFAEAGIGEG